LRKKLEEIEACAVRAKRRGHGSISIERLAEVLATTCPFYLLTFEDAVKTTGSEGKIQVMDIAELLTLAL